VLLIDCGVSGGGFTKDPTSIVVTTPAGVIVDVYVDWPIPSDVVLVAVTDPGIHCVPFLINVSLVALLPCHRGVESLTKVKVG